MKRSFGWAWILGAVCVLVVVPLGILFGETYLDTIEIVLRRHESKVHAVLVATSVLAAVHAVPAVVLAARGHKTLARRWFSIIPVALAVPLYYLGYGTAYYAGWTERTLVGVGILLTFLSVLGCGILWERATRRRPLREVLSLMVLLVVSLLAASWTTFVTWAVWKT